GLNGQRVITRVKDSSTQAHLVFPYDPNDHSTIGVPQVNYVYSGTDLASVTDVSTGRTWAYVYDLKHNLAEVHTPLEPLGTTPLVQYAYTPTNPTHIMQVTEQVRQSDGTPGDPVDVFFNAYNQPTSITAHHRSGDLLPD